MNELAIRFITTKEDTNTNNANEPLSHNLHDTNMTI